MNWTVLLPSEADVGAVRARLERAGAAYEARGAGLLARDPSGNAVLIAPDPAAG